MDVPRAAGDAPGQTTGFVAPTERTAGPGPLEAPTQPLKNVVDFRLKSIPFTLWVIHPMDT